METAISQHSNLMDNTPKKYHTFQIVNVKNKKARSTGILSKMSWFFFESAASPSIKSESTESNESSNTNIGNIRNIGNITNNIFYLFYFNILSCSISFSLIQPSLWCYLRELECTPLYLAYCISIYAIGELLGSYLSSIIKNKYNTKFLLILSILNGIFGGFIYGTAGLLQYYYAPYSVLLGRIMQGIWTGMEQYTEIKYISDNIDISSSSSHSQQRQKQLKIISFISCIGFIIGPCIGAALQLFQFNINSVIIINGNMLCGYFIMILCFIQLIVTIIIFHDIKKTTPSNIKKPANTITRTLIIQARNKNKNVIDSIQYQSNLTPPPSSKDHDSMRRWLDSASPPSTLNTINTATIDNDNDNDDTEFSLNTFHRTSVAEMLNIETPSAICTPYTPYNQQQIYNENVKIGNNNKYNIKYIKSYTTFNKFASIVMTFCFLIHFEAFSIQQTMTSYLIKRKFDWNVMFANYLFILCAILWMLSFYIINKLLMIKTINHNCLVKLSLFMGVISTFCLISITFQIQYNEYLYLFGFILLSFTFPFGRASVLTFYCLCTNYKYIEWIYLVSIISRIITPFIGIGLYFTNNGPSWMYGNITVLFMIAIILCSLTTSHLNKQKIPKKINIINHGYSVVNIPQVFYFYH